MARPVWPTRPSGWPCVDRVARRAEDGREVAVAGGDVAGVTNLDHETVAAGGAGPHHPARRRRPRPASPRSARRSRARGACGGRRRTDRPAARRVTRCRPARPASAAGPGAAWRAGPARRRGRCRCATEPAVRADQHRRRRAPGRRSVAALVVVPLRVQRDPGADQLEERGLGERAHQILVQVRRQPAPRLHRLEREAAALRRWPRRQRASAANRRRMGRWAGPAAPRRPPPPAPGPAPAEPPRRPRGPARA